MMVAHIYVMMVGNTFAKKRSITQKRTLDWLSCPRAYVASGPVQCQRH